jgi:Ras GTPase-activating-like protein IQGAP2/3
MRNINEHHAFLSAQLDAYKEYLANVRQNCSTGSKKSSKKESKKAVALKRKGPFKYSHAQLEKDGIIIESEVPDDRYVWSCVCGRVAVCITRCSLVLSLLHRRSAIFFAFSCNSPGIFDVTVMYRSRHIAKISLQLDDLLEKQHMGQLEFETDFLKLNVNLLIYLLNKDFIS